MLSCKAPTEPSIFRHFTDSVFDSVAGSHTTSGTLTLLFSHILQNPKVLERVVSEVDAQLGDVTSTIVPVEGLEAKMEYLMACLNENFRMNSVFTMPLERRVTAPTGFDIEGHHIPKGVSHQNHLLYALICLPLQTSLTFPPEQTVVFSLNHVVHHNPSIWGSDHDTFDPSRFLGDKGEDLKRFLSPFSIGHRMCIGKNMAMTNMLKLVSTTFKHYALEMVHPEEKIATLSVGISEKEGPLICRVKRREKTV